VPEYGQTIFLSKASGIYLYLFLEDYEQFEHIMQMRAETKFKSASTTALFNKKEKFRVLLSLK
jgi:hypothetical protein